MYDNELDHLTLAASVNVYTNILDDRHQNLLDFSMKMLCIVNFNKYFD